MSAVEIRCECGSPECRETVALTAAAEDALQRTNQPVLAPGHRLDRVREAQRSAAAAGEEARAVRSQAAQQVRRSRRNLAAARLELRARVLVVDDSETFRRVAASLVSAAVGLRLVGVAESGEEAIKLLPELKPDLVVLDVHMPGLGGLETARVIRSHSPDTVVVLVSADAGAVAVDLAAIGAAAFVSKAALRTETLGDLWLKHAPRA